MAPHLRDVESISLLRNKRARHQLWFPFCHLILQRKGELKAETVQVVYASQALRLGRER